MLFTYEDEKVIDYISDYNNLLYEQPEIVKIP